MSANEPITAEHLSRDRAQASDLVQTPSEARFNRLVRIARRALGTRVATISFLGAEGEWFKAVTGWNVGQLVPERSLAASLVQGPDPVAIADMADDPRTRNHPLVVSSPRFRFCALQPILSRSGGTTGLVAVYDISPRKVTRDVLEALSDVAELVRRELRVPELGGLQQTLLNALDVTQRETLLDDLTRVWNRRGGMQLLEQALEGGRADSTIGACVMDADDFKQVNDRYGYAMGNVVLNKLAATIVDSVRPGDVVCRLGADEFLLLIPEVDPDQLGHIMDRVKGRAQSLVVRTRVGSVKTTVSIGGTIAGAGERAEDVVQRASEAMRDGKRRRVSEAPPERDETEDEAATSTDL